MKKIVVLILFIFNGALIYGQTSKSEGYFYNESMQIRTPNDFYNSQRAKGEGPSSFLTEEQVEGSPYLSKEFMNGDIIIDNFKFVGIPLRYNIYNDDIEFQKDDQILAIANPHEVRRIFIGDMAFIYSAYILSKEQTYGYFQLLSDGKAKVLKKYEISYQMPKAEQAYRPEEPAKFIPVPCKLYVTFGNDPALKFTNAKKLMKLFGDKKSEVEKFLKTEKLNLKNEEDLVSLLTYYNSL